MLLLDLLIPLRLFESRPLLRFVTADQVTGGGAEKSARGASRGGGVADEASKELVTHAGSNRVDIGITVPDKSRKEGRRKVPRTINSRSCGSGA